MEFIGGIVEIRLILLSLILQIQNLLNIFLIPLIGGADGQRKNKKGYS